MDTSTLICVNDKSQQLFKSIQTGGFIIKKNITSEGIYWELKDPKKNIRRCVGDDIDPLRPINGVLLIVYFYT